MALFQLITLQFAHYCCLWVNSTTVLLTALHYAGKSSYAFNVATTLGHNSPRLVPWPYPAIVACSMNSASDDSWLKLGNEARPNRISELDKLY